MGNHPSDTGMSGSESIHRLSEYDENCLLKAGCNNLHKAIIRADMNLFLAELHKINVNAANNNGDTPLHFAAATESGQEFILELINKRADVNAQNKSLETPLHFAALCRNVENFQVLMKETNIKVNAKNVKGETPLHMAAQSDSLKELTLKLIEKGADVNAENKWRQTPLHYAAIGGCINTIKVLIENSKTDVNAKDVSGYNALHSLIGSCSNPCLSDSKKAIRILLDKTTDINSQTSFGHSILHLSVMRKRRSNLIEFFIFNYQEKINTTLKDKMGDTFLHVYARDVRRPDSQFFTLLSRILKRKHLNTLLVEKNVMGKTPLDYLDYRYGSEMLDTAVNLILEFRVCVSKGDNLGNTLFHRVVSQEGFCYKLLNDLGGTQEEERPCAIDTLIKSGADLNVTNIFGESAVFARLTDGSFDVLLRNKVDWNVKNRWDRTPLISIMMYAHFIHTPYILNKIIDEGKVDVNAVDTFMSTPLHLAAYLFFPVDLVEELLRHGADITVKDNLGDTPLDTAKRHRNFEFYEMYSDSVIKRKDDTFNDILKNLPSEIKASDMTPQHVRNLLGLPIKLEPFMDYLMKEFYLGCRPCEEIKEANKIRGAINNLVRSLCEKMEKYDTLFKMSSFPTGSMEEETKVGRPDEFDFVISLETIRNITEIESIEDSENAEFACLKFKENEFDERYLPFSDMDGYFLALPFLQYFLRFMRRALNEPDLWENKKDNPHYYLHYASENKMKVIQYKPVFNFVVYWIGSVHKQLEISVDLVPAVYEKGWWPTKKNVDHFALMNNEIKSIGCFLMLQTKTNIFDNKQKFMKDGINQTCNIHSDEIAKFSNYETDTELEISERKLRISAALAEICLVKSMPKTFREAYVLAKIIKQTICPQILIDEEWVKDVNPAEKIKSYMLKNCTFFILSEMVKSKEENISALKITSKIYKLLMRCAESKEINERHPYFLPNGANMMEIPKDYATIVPDHTRHPKRRLCVQLVLDILQT